MSGNKARHTTPQTNIGRRVSYSQSAGSQRKLRIVFQSFADLVVIAKEFYPIPFRTRPSKPSASMVLRLKPRESRTLPGLPRTERHRSPPTQFNEKPRWRNPAGLFAFGSISRSLLLMPGARRGREILDFHRAKRASGQDLQMPADLGSIFRVQIQIGVGGCASQLFGGSKIKQSIAVAT
jgi:hypothetical protein